jgi:hypothetical protein
MERLQLKRVTLAIIDVFVPTALGMACYIAIFAVTVLVNQPSQYKDTWHTVIVSDLQGTASAIHIDTIGHLIKTQAANTVTLYAFWLVVAMAIFALGTKLTKNVNELAEDVGLRYYIWPKGADRNAPLKEFFEKLVYRLVVAIILVVYLARALPWLSLQWKGADLAISFGLHSLTVYLPLFIAEVVFLHLTVVILRLFLIKKRIA